MKKIIVLFFWVFFIARGAAFASNGDNLISIGPISRSMGGVGVAKPQDAISAVFANPAAMCFGPYCPGSEFNFAFSYSVPNAKVRVTIADQLFEPKPKNSVYIVPAIGFSIPVSKKTNNLRFGLAAYGISGIGADYRGTSLDQPAYYDVSHLFGLPPGSTRGPLVQGEFVELGVWKVAPSLALQLTDKFSAGFSAHINRSSLDLRSGSSSEFGYGFQVGGLYKINDLASLGFAYISPQSADHKKIKDFDSDGAADDLEIESPTQLHAGLAVDLKPEKWLVEFDLKWFNWSEAEGYKDFDWGDQWVFAIGTQVKPTKELSLRAGYNYGKNPVKEHENFAGTSSAVIQGKTLPTYYYETFRMIGLPAVVEHHLTLGISYEFSKSIALHAGGVYGFENEIIEHGTGIDGTTPVTIASSLYGYSLDFGMTLRF